MFYSLRHHSRCLCRTTGGILCAGRTPEEALVQGISDLLAQRTAASLQNISAAPEIPESVLAGYPDAFGMYRLLKQEYGEHIRLRDISGSGIQLTAALSFPSPQDGSMRFSYCSHPDAGTALRRLFRCAALGYTCTDTCSFAGDTDAAQLTMMLEKLLRSGCDILIGDCSHAGLYVYRVFIPEPEDILLRLPAGVLQTPASLMQIGG